MLWGKAKRVKPYSQYSIELGLCISILSARVKDWMEGLNYMNPLISLRIIYTFCEYLKIGGKLQCYANRRFMCSKER